MVDKPGSLIYNFTSMEVTAWGCFVFFMRAFVAFLAILDPIGNMLFFVGLTEDYSEEKKNVTLKKAILASFLTLLLFSLFGKHIFSLFHITIESFSIAGGILLFFIAYEMIRGEYPSVKKTASAMMGVREKEDISIFPLAIPMISGPGAITLAVVLMGEAKGFLRHALLITALVIALIVVFIVMKSAIYLRTKLGRTGLSVISRLMGIILAAMAVQFVIEGIHSAFS